MSDDRNYDDVPLYDRPTRDSIRGTCQSCAFYYRDGERAWWGTCALLFEGLPEDIDDDSAVLTNDWESCEKYEESDKIAEEALDRWRLMYSY